MSTSTTKTVIIYASETQTFAHEVEVPADMTEQQLEDQMDKLFDWSFAKCIEHDVDYLGFEEGELD